MARRGDEGEPAGSEGSDERSPPPAEAGDPTVKRAKPQAEPDDQAPTRARGRRRASGSSKAATSDESESRAGGAAPPATLAAASPSPDEPITTVAGVPADLGLAARVRDAQTVQTTLAAALAWSITVAPAAFARGSALGAQVPAILALAVGLGGPVVATRHRRIGRHLGVTGFLLLCVLAWLEAAPAISPGRLDPTRAALGAVAWGVFALAWSDRWKRPAAAPVDPNAPSLAARAALPPFAVPIAAGGALCSIALLVLAWRVRESDRAVVAHALAALAAVGLVSASAAVAIGRGKRAPSGGRRLTSAATRPLVLLAAVAVAGAVIMALR